MKFDISRYNLLKNMQSCTNSFFTRALYGAATTEGMGKCIAINKF